MIVIKEEFVGGDKYVRAVEIGGAAAVMMWLALKRYAAQYPKSEGFIPDEDIERLPGAPRSPRKALWALVECGRLLPDMSRGAGLVDPVEGGWYLHDYDDHAEAPEVTELRRERTRLRVQQHREQKRRELDLIRSQTAVTLSVTPDVTPDVTQTVTQTVTPVTTGVTPVTSRDRQGPRARRVHARARPQPNPTQIQTTETDPPQQSPVIKEIPADFALDDELRADAAIAGVQDPDKWLAKLRRGPIGGRRGIFLHELRDYIRGQFGNWKTWEETQRAKALKDASASNAGEPAEETWL